MPLLPPSHEPEEFNRDVKRRVELLETRLMGVAAVANAAGVATGGAAGTVLVKNSATDYDTAWQGGAWSATYTPALYYGSTPTNFLLGTSPTAFGDYVKVGKTVSGYARMVLGSSLPANTFTGTLYIDLPLATTQRRANMPCGTFWIARGSTYYTGMAAVNYIGARTVAILFGQTGIVTGAMLGTLAQNDIFQIYFNYETT